MRYKVLPEYHCHSYTYHARDSLGNRYLAESNRYWHEHEDGHNPEHEHPVFDALEKRIGFPSKSEWTLVGGQSGRDI